MTKDSTLEYLEDQLIDTDDTFSSGSGTPPYRRPYQAPQPRLEGAPPPPMVPATSSSTGGGNAFSFHGMQNVAMGLRKPDLSGLVGQLNAELRQGMVPRSPRGNSMMLSAPSFSPPLTQVVPLPQPTQALSFQPPPLSPRAAPSSIPMVVPPKSAWAEDDKPKPADLVISPIASQLREREEADARARSICAPAALSVAPRISAPALSWRPPPVEGFAWPKPPISPAPPMVPLSPRLPSPPVIVSGSPRSMSPPPMLRAAPLSPGGSLTAPVVVSGGSRLPAWPMSPGGSLQAPVAAPGSRSWPLSPGGSLQAPLAPMSPGGSVSAPLAFVAPPLPPVQSVMQASRPCSVMAPPSIASLVAAPSGISPSALSFGRSVSSPREAEMQGPSLVRRRSNPEGPVVVTTTTTVTPSTVPSWSHAPPMILPAKSTSVAGGVWKASVARQSSPIRPILSSPRQVSGTGLARLGSSPSGYRPIQAPRAINVFGSVERPGQAVATGPSNAREMYKAITGTTL